METRTLANTDLAVSRLCLGAMTFGAQADEAASRSMVDLCLDHGVNFIDTANVYTGGESETLLGRILEGRRDRVVLASKVGNRCGDEPTQVGLSRAAIERQIDESLRRLRTDHLDLYYLHQPDDSTPLEESLATMSGLVERGKIRYVGASNYAGWQLCRMLWLADRHEYSPVRVTQPMYNLIARGIEQELLPMCRECALSTIVYNPLAGGLLTGKHRAGRPAARGTRFDGNENYQKRYWHAQNFEAVNELARVADREGRSLVSLALCWLVHHTAADCVVLGASRLEQLQENLTAASEGPLSESALSACETVWRTLRGVTPTYNR